VGGNSKIKRDVSENPRNVMYKNGIFGGDFEKRISKFECLATLALDHVTWRTTT